MKSIVATIAGPMRLSYMIDVVHLIMNNHTHKGSLFGWAPGAPSNGRLYMTTVGDVQTRLLVRGLSRIVLFNVSKVL